MHMYVYICVYIYTYINRYVCICVTLNKAFPCSKSRLEAVTKAVGDSTLTIQQLTDILSVIPEGHTQVSSLLPESHTQVSSLIPESCTQVWSLFPACLLFL